MKLVTLLSKWAPVLPSRALPQLVALVLLAQTAACERTNKLAPSQDSAADEATEKTVTEGEGPPSSVQRQKGKLGGAPSEKPGAKAAAKIISALPGDDIVQPVVNPKKLQPYAGKTGIVRGIVRATGDLPPARPEVLKKMDASCTDSRVTFGKLFREGPERQLADVLVAVTEYEGYVPAKEVDVKIMAKGCAWPSRTIAMTFGQRLSIDGADNRPYVPEILGQPMPAQLFVLPTAPPVELPPKKPGRYKLVDSMRLFNVSELFVLAYSTMDVTDQSGTFEITGVPVGKVKVNAFLPQTGAVSTREIVVEAGKATELSFELAFDLREYEKKEKPIPLDELPAPK
jgi:hypothetical protein